MNEKLITIWQRFKYWILSLLAIPVALALISVDAPVGAADSLPWNTIAVNTIYDTASGRLEEGQFASTTYGWIWINDGVTESKRRKMFVGTSTPTEIKGLKQVNVASETCQIQYTKKDNSKTAYENYSCEDWYTKVEKNNEKPAPKLVTRLWQVKQALAGIAYQSDTDTACTACSSASFSFTNTGSDTGIVVIGDFNDATDADRDITASTYGGISLTQGARGNDDTTDNTTEQWYIANPLQGANTLSITLAGAVTDGYFNTSQYTGVLTTGMSDANNSATQANETSVSYTITTVAANTAIVDGASSEIGTGSDCEPNSGQTEILDIDTGFGSMQACAGYELNQGAAGAKTVSWTCSGIACTTTTDWTAAGMSLAPESEEPAESTTWWDTSFLYRRKITFNNAPSQQTLTNFPVNVFLSQNANDEAAPNNITYANVTANGGDIRFVDADQTTMLKHEIEKWDTAATSTVWVKVPKITATSTTDHIWMYYGNTATSSGAATTSVWDLHFKGVWHLTATSTAARKFINSVGTTTDGIGTNFDSDEYTTTGTKIDGALDFDGGNPNDYINNGTASMMNFFAADSRFTVSGWMKPDDFGLYSTIGARWSNTNSRQYNIQTAVTTGAPQMILSTSGSGTTYTLVGATALSTTNWSYLAGTADIGADNYFLYSNAIVVDSDTTASAALFNNSSAIVSIGATKEGTDDMMDGKLDEIRISDTVRSADWLQQEYRYGLASSTTHTYGTEENVPVVGGAARTSTSTIFKSDTIFKSNVILNYLFIQSLAYYWRRKWMN